MHKLLQNIRAAEADQAFKDYLPGVGVGTRKFERPGVPPGAVDLLPGMGVDTIDQLINTVFEEDPHHNGERRAILTPRNVDAFYINDKVSTLRRLYFINNNAF